MASKQTYVCPMPGCDNKVTVMVKLTHPPTCSRHTGGGRLMERKGDKHADVRTGGSTD
jgi:hypothetical protein